MTQNIRKQPLDQDLAEDTRERIEEEGKDLITQLTGIMCKYLKMGLTIYGSDFIPPHNAKEILKLLEAITNKNEELLKRMTNTYLELLKKDGS